MPNSYRAFKGGLAPIFGLSLAWLTAGQACAQALPSGGEVKAGAAEILAAPGHSLSVVQSSDKAIIDWRSFSVGQGGAVDFRNGSGATLNRVTGGSLSLIDGLLTGTGSVYLVNPNGVVIGKSGQVNVGGGFIASTLDIPADGFLAGGDITASGVSAAAVVNYGKIGALGGDVVLTAARVENHGDVTAPVGATGLLAGYEVLLRDRTVEGGKFAVKLGGPGTSVTNDGAIRAAQAELRANGGDVFALAGNGSGVIDARGVSTADGRIYLIAGDAGSVTVEGSLTARGAGDAAGTIETSAGTVTVGAAKIDAGPGGTWLLDPTVITIDQTAANTIAATLAGNTSVTQDTTGSGSGGGDITINPNVTLSWASGASLNLRAWRNIVVGAGSHISGNNNGTLKLYSGLSANGVGTVFFGSGSTASAYQLDIYYNPTSNPAGTSIPNSTSYATADSFAANVTRNSGNDYMWVNGYVDFYNIRNNLSGAYALSKDVVDDGIFTPIGSSATPFRGILDGMGHGFAGFFVGSYGSDFVGLFAMNSGTLKNISGLQISVSGHDIVGALAGWNYGTIDNVSSTLAGNGSPYPHVQANNYVGGLVGVNHGRITNVQMTPDVTAANYVGGVVGFNSTEGLVSGVSSLAGSTVRSSGWYSGGVIGQNFGRDLGTQSGNGQAIGLTSAARVNGTYGVGGVVGDNEGQLLGSSFSGLAAGSSHVGGLVGVNTASGLVNQGTFSGTVYAGGQTGNYYAGGLVGTNSGTVVNSTVTSAVSVAGVQAVGGAVGVNYGYANNLTVSAYNIQGSNFVGGVVGWNDQAGQVGAGAFTGKVAGTQYYTGGIVGLNGGAITGASMQGQVTGAYGVGGVAGTSSGSIVNSSVAPVGNMPNSAVITGTGYVGGLAGYNFGSITNSGATTTVNGRDYIGGMVGWNGVGSTITGGTVVGFVISTPPAGAFGYYAGGIAGLNTGSINGSTSFATVTSGAGVGGLVGINYGQIGGASANGPVNGGYYQIGGAVGLNQAGSLNNVTATGLVSGGYERIGGLVGENWASISSSHATGNVSGTTFSDSTQGGVGGFVGQNQGGATIATSNASGSVASGVHHAGGFAGINYGTITDSASSGNVDNTAGELDAGGFVGLTTGIVTGSHATGSARAANTVGGFAGENDNVIRNSWSSGAAYGGSNAGGFVGINRGGEITNAFSTGAVSGTDRVGGFVGYAGGYIANAYSSGSVTGSAARVGGFVGELETGEIASIYSYGPISDPGYALAGVAGKSTGTITNAYWDVVTTNTYTPVTTGSAGSAAPVNGRYGSPYSASSYPGLDFVNSWRIQEGVSRPVLRTPSP